MTPALSTAARRATVAGFALAAGLFLAADVSAQQEQQGPSGRTRVLVPPLQTTGGVSNDFANNVAQRVRRRLQNFNILTAVTGDQMEQALDKFGLNRNEMTPVQWQQLANEVGAGLILFGETQPASGGQGVEVTMRFVDAKTGDELRSPSFSVSGDGGDGRSAAADQIASSLDTQVSYQRALLFCQDYFGAEQYADALRNCNKALSINENSTQALMVRGQIFRERGEWEDARQDFATVVDNNPSNTNALQNLAYVNAQLGNTDRATELYREYLTFNPDDAQIRLSVAYDLASADALDEAISLLREGIERDSTNASLWEYMGDVALNKGTASEGREVKAQGGGEVQDTAAVQLAVNAYERVMDLRDSVQTGLIQNTIKAHLQMGNLDEALKFAERALDNRPDDASVLSLKATILARQENYSDAAAVMDSVLSADPDFNQGYLRRGNYRLQAGVAVEEVLPDFKQAVKHGTSGNAIANSMLATGFNNYWKNNDRETATRLFEAGLEFAESGSDAAHQLHFFLGYGAYLRGEQFDKQNTEEACQPAKQALAAFQEAVSHLKQAGDYQAANQKKVEKAAGDYIYRQNQIIKKAC